MKQIRGLQWVLTLVFVGYSFTSLAITGNEYETKILTPFKEGRLLVKFVAGAPPAVVEQIADQLNASEVQIFQIVPGLVAYEYELALDVQEVLEMVLDNAHVEYAEPDFYHIAQAQNDPRFPEQWALENIGQTGGTVDKDINATSMWQIEDGDQNVVIGVLDTGVDKHPDLIPNLWQNVREITANGIDDDLNGYIDDDHGINAITNSGNPLDDHGHGTHVSGTIGADGNNSLGVVGVSQNVQIASCKFLDQSGKGLTSDAIQCLQYFASLKTRPINPVNIIATNNSWGGGGSSISLRDAIQVHQNLGILFVAAAGNEGKNNDVAPFYPASYELANVISVGATDHNDRLAGFSNYGKRSVHVTAPGARILSTYLNEGYALLSGTSMAAPHVAGLIAIIKSAFPAFDYRQIKNLVLSSGTPIALLQNTIISGRRIRGADTNGTGALSCVNQTVSSRLKPTENNLSILLGTSIFLSSSGINCSSPSGPITLYSAGGESVVLRDNGLNGDLLANDGIYSLLWTPLSAKTYILNFGDGDPVTLTVREANTPSAYTANSLSFAYETIVGSSLGAKDETVHAVNVPFSIHFNGSAIGYATLYVSTNGTISFSSSTNPGYLNRTLPTTIATTLVAPYWDDLIPSGGNSNIFVATTGVAPNRRFVVEWRNLRSFNATGLGTFQAIFYENSPDIRFNYLDTDFSNIAYSFGKSATVGVQTTLSAATLFSFNAANIPSQSSLLFRYQ